VQYVVSKTVLLRMVCPSSVIFWREQPWGGPPPPPPPPPAPRPPPPPPPPPPGGGRPTATRIKKVL
jgi:hypothetical protein